MSESSRVHARVRDVFVNVFTNVVVFMHQTEYGTEYHVNYTPPDKINTRFVYSNL